MIKQKREYYLDWVRLIAVALLTPHHIAITFSRIGDAYVFLPEPDTSIYFLVQSLFLNLWFMRALFFVSGVSTYFALKSRTNKQYCLERTKKLLLPFFFGIVFLLPAMAYFRALNTVNYQGTFIAFYPVFFTRFETYLGWGHLWFLVYLYVFSMLFLLFRILLKNKKRYFEQAGVFLAKGKNMIFPMFVIILFEMIFRPFYPSYQNLVSDWANFTVYFSFFILGYIVASHARCLDKIETNLFTFFIVSLISTVCFIALECARNYTPLFSGFYASMKYEYSLVSAFLRGIAGYSLVMLITGAAKKHLNVNNRTYKYLSNTSFALYLFHFLIATVVMYFLIRVKINHCVLYIGAIVFVYALFAILFELILKRVPFLRFVCNIKRL